MSRKLSKPITRSPPEVLGGSLHVAPESLKEIIVVWVVPTATIHFLEFLSLSFFFVQRGVGDSYGALAS